MKTAKRFLAAAALSLSMAFTPALAFNPSAFPAAIKPGDILVSPTFSFGNYYGLSTAIAITGSVDYAMGLSFPLTLGGEVGYATVTGYSDNFGSLPILFRAGWHPDFGSENLDSYATIKIGYNVLLTGASGPGYEYGGGVSYGFGVGGRYFFNQTMAAFAEIGYDQYAISYEFDYGNTGIPGYTGKYSWSYYIYTWLHVGVTFKF